MAQKFLGQANLCQTRLEQYNAIHMTDTIMYIYGFPLGKLQGIDERKLMSNFRKERRLRQANNDFLRNNGALLKDEERGMMLTGCDVSANILRSLTGIQPKRIQYPKPTVEMTASGIRSRS